MNKITKSVVLLPAILGLNAQIYASPNGMVGANSIKNNGKIFNECSLGFAGFDCVLP